VPADSPAASADPPGGRTVDRRGNRAIGGRGNRAVGSHDDQAIGARGDQAVGTRGDQTDDPPGDPETVARAICLRLLTDRARTRAELAAVLRRRGVPDAVADRVLGRFSEVGLIDDATFAEQWVRSRHASRGLARRALAVELHRKGVDRDVAEEALAGVDTESERRRARELIDRRLRTLALGGPEERARAGRRLLGMLARKGYPASVATEVVRAALAERGAEEDELGPPDFG
jgi:regulatory protein